MRFAAALVAIVLAAGTGLLAREPARLTKVTARTMDPRVLTRRLFGDLGRIMLPAYSHGRPGARPVYPLQQLEFMTVPRATYTPGLCQTSMATVRFVPDGPLAGADTPVRPNAIEARQAYVIANLDRLRGGNGLSEADRQRLDVACAAVDPRAVPTIRAPDTYILATGVRELAGLEDAVHAGHPGAALLCPTSQDETPTADAECLQRIAQLDIHQIAAVSTCVPVPARRRCFWLEVGDWTVQLEADSITGPLSRVIVEERSIIIDERRD